MRRTIRSAVLAMSIGVGLASPAAIAAVPEPWQPYPEGSLFLPADRYCGDFDLQSVPVKQDVKSRVLERYDSGAIRVQEFTGPLVVEVTNLTSGESVTRNISGYAVVTFREDGSIATYEMHGPIGFGWPQDDTYERGFYVMNGYHVFAFDESGGRTTLVDQGNEENLCDVLS